LSSAEAQSGLSRILIGVLKGGDREIMESELACGAN
jgi:hypothetical protein